MPDELMPQGKILLYSSDGEKEFVSVVFQNETFWFTQKAMAELFDVKTMAISKHADYISEFDRQTAKYLKGGGDP